MTIYAPTHTSGVVQVALPAQKKPASLLLCQLHTSRYRMPAQRWKNAVLEQVCPEPRPSFSLNLQVHSWTSACASSNAWRRPWLSVHSCCTCRLSRAREPMQAKTAIPYTMCIHVLTICWCLLLGAAQKRRATKHEQCSGESTIP